MNDILVIIPAYNEEMNITFVAENLIRNYPDLDYVIVNGRIALSGGRLTGVFAGNVLEGNK